MSDVLTDSDRLYLESKSFDFEAVVEANMICLVIKSFPLPTGYEPARADLLLRLPLQFPDVPPDMFWMDPPVRYAGGVVPPATELLENYVGRQWQRWSRHFGASAWRPGVDDLRSYLRLITATLERERPANAE
jgi:hypothetical protein